MDGPWQICGKTAYEYGRVANETAKLMRWVDEDLTLAACGSSQRALSTYAAWEYEVLMQCFDKVDFISLHAYFRNDSDNIQTFFKEVDNLDYFIREVAAIADAVAAKKGSTKKIMLSLDEWNVWYKAHRPQDLKKPGWPEAPPLLEEIYNFEDALIVGGALIVMMNNADRVKVACLAQLVNVIGAIFTETGGAAWRQTIFHPFAQASRYGRGQVLQLKTTFDAAAAQEGEAAGLMTTLVLDDEGGEATLFALNRSDRSEVEVTADLAGLGEGWRVKSASQLHHADLKAVNTAARPDEVSPRDLDGAMVEDGRLLKAFLKPLSWNVVSLTR
jgi:alpha-N-arabinofuranosidase